MKNEDLASELVERLNKMIEDPDIRKDVSALLRQEVITNEATLVHPAIQVGSLGSLRFLGLLNGIVGVKEDGEGYICAVWEGKIVQRFRRNE